MNHPLMVIAFTLLRRDGMTPEDGEAGILSFAALKVVRHRESEASFALAHRVYDRDQQQGPGVYADMRALLSPGCLVIGEAPPEPAPLLDDNEVQRRCHDGMLTGLPMIGAEEPPNVSAMVLRGLDKRMAGMAENHDIPLTGDDASTVQRARGLADRVQALWLTWLCTCCDYEEVEPLAAALGAWRRIEAARPLPF